MYMCVRSRERQAASWGGAWRGRGNRGLPFARLSVKRIQAHIRRADGSARVLTGARRGLLCWLLLPALLRMARVWGNYGGRRDVRRGARPRFRVWVRYLACEKERERDSTSVDRRKKRERGEGAQLRRREKKINKSEGRNKNKENLRNIKKNERKRKKKKKKKSQI